MLKNAGKYFEIALHILLWSLLCYVLYQAFGVRVIKLMIKGNVQSTVTHSNSILGFVIADIVGKVILFYLNVFLLIPTYLKSRRGTDALKIVGAFLGTLVFTALVEYFYVQTDTANFYKSPILLFLYSLVLHGFILFFAFGYRMTKDWTRNEEQKKRIESEQLRTELNFLKSQINPHFLFNTLNNLFAEARKHEDKTVANGIAKLSHIMRYMIYESNVEFIALEKEIQYLNSYIELQKLRIAPSDPFELKMEISPGTAHAMVAPIIFIPFVENAFKHGLDYEKPSFIHIAIAIENDLLTFTIKNSRFDHIEHLENSGIGLNNIRRRLALLYPNQHSLEIQSTSNEFSVHLTIQMQQAV